MPAIGGDFVGARAGQEAALVAGMPGTGADIIGIEQKGVVGMEGLVALAVLAEQELLEEPGGMGAVPFRRAGVRHRLDELVFGAQAARRGARSRRGRPDRLPPNSGRGCRNRRKVTGRMSRTRRRLLVSSQVSPVRGRERWSGELVPGGQSVLDRGSVPGKKPSPAMILMPSGYMGLASRGAPAAPGACRILAILLWMHNGLGYIYGQYRVRRASSRPVRRSRRGLCPKRKRR